MSTQVVYKPHRPSSATSVEIPCLEARCSSKGQKFGPQSELSRNVLELLQQWQLAVNESHVALTMLIAFAANSAYNLHFPGVYGQGSHAAISNLRRIWSSPPHACASGSLLGPKSFQASSNGTFSSRLCSDFTCPFARPLQSLCCPPLTAAAWAATCRASW